MGPSQRVGECSRHNFALIPTHLFNPTFSLTQFFYLLRDSEVFLTGCFVISDSAILEKKKHSHIQYFSNCPSVPLIAKPNYCKVICLFSWVPKEGWLAGLFKTRANVDSYSYSQRLAQGWAPELYMLSQWLSKLSDYGFHFMHEGTEAPG